MAYPAWSSVRLKRRSSGVLVLALVAVLAVLAALPAAALAAPPANDAFAVAETLTGDSASATGTTLEATKETGEPTPYYGTRSVWYRWVAPYTGVATVDTAGSDFEATVGAYTGATVDGLSQLEVGYGRVRFRAVGGRAYMLQVDGYYGQSGSLSLALQLHASPANDDFASAEQLVGDTATATGDTTGAWKEAGEPWHVYDGSKGSIWYEWTAPASGGVVVDTAGSSIDTTLAVYTGSNVAGLVQVAANNDASSSTYTSLVTFNAVAGTTYRIAVSGYEYNDRGSVNLALRLVPPPVNDLFANATVLPGDADVTAGGNSVGATAEVGEPGHFFGHPPYRSLWYSWTAPRDGSLTIRASDSNQGAIPAAYTGDSVSELGRVTNQATYPGYSNVIRIRVRAGVTYKIAVDRLSPNPVGEFGLTLALTDSPPNDDFADAEPLDGTSADVDGTNVGATQEPGEPIHDQNYYDPSVWYTWTAPETASVTLDLAGSELIGVIGVYTGDSVSALARVRTFAVNGGPRAKLRFRAEAGTTYRFAVDGAQGRQDTFHLALRSNAPPANDLFVDAQPLTGADATATADTSHAYREPGEPSHGSAWGQASVWYEWTAPTSGGVTLDTVGSSFHTTLGVYTGDDVAELTTVATSYTNTGRYGDAKVVFDAVEGTTYRIALDGYYTDSLGSAQMNLRLRPPPENDLFANATVLAGDAQLATGRNDGALAEPGEPSHYAYWIARSSVWYEWTAPKDGSLTIRADATFTAALAVYTGDSVSELTSVPIQAQVGGQPHNIRVRVAAGTTYRIAVDSVYADSSGDFTLTLGLVDRPANDDFADAALLAGTEADADGTNVGATQEAGEPIHEENYYDPSVWYEWTAPASGGVTLDLAGSQLNGVIAVYTGDSVGELARVASAPANQWDARAKRRFRAVGGTTYRIAIDGAHADQGTFHLALRWRPRPANDMFASAQVLSGAEATADGDNIGATGEPGEPLPGATEGASVWYSWTAPSSGKGVVRTLSSDFGSGVSVFTGDDVDSLTPVTATLYPDEERNFEVHEGTTYKIAVHGQARPNRGIFKLKIGVYERPPNDNFADAHELEGESDAATHINVQAGRESGEPYHAYNYASHSIWYRWTAPADGNVTLDTAGSSFRTVLGVYTGGSVSTLTAVASNGSTQPDGSSRVSFTAAGGVTYRIALDGWYNDTGEAHIGLAFEPSAEPPPNDAFAGALPIDASGVTGTNVGATREAGEPHHLGYSIGHSVWYRWTAPTSDEVAIHIGSAGFASTLEVYSGDSLASLQRVPDSNPADTGNQARRVFLPTAGETYWVAVDGEPGWFGNFTVMVVTPPEPVDGGPPPGGGDDGVGTGGDPDPGPDPQPESTRANDPAAPGDTGSGYRGPAGHYAPQPALPPEQQTAPEEPLEFSYSPARQSLGSVFKRGLTGTATCSSACSVAATVKVDAATARKYRLRGAATTIARGRASAIDGGTATLTVRLPKPMQRKLRSAKVVRFTVTVRALAGGQPARTVTRRLTLRR